MKSSQHACAIPGATDSELAEHVQNLLRTPSGHGSQVHVVASAGIIRLSGKVRTFFQRQMAAALVRRVPEVREIVDELDVGP